MLLCRYVCLILLRRYVCLIFIAFAQVILLELTVKPRYHSVLSHALMVARAQSINVSAMRTSLEIDAKLLVKYFIYYSKHSNILINDKFVLLQLHRSQTKWSKSTTKVGFQQKCIYIMICKTLMVIKMQLCKEEALLLYKVNLA